MHLQYHPKCTVAFIECSLPSARFSSGAQPLHSAHPMQEAPLSCSPMWWHNGLYFCSKDFKITCLCLAFHSQVAFLVFTIQLNTWHCCFPGSSEYLVPHRQPNQYTSHGCCNSFPFFPDHPVNQKTSMHCSFVLHSGG